MNKLKNTDKLKKIILVIEVMLLLGKLFKH